MLLNPYINIMSKFVRILLVALVLLQIQALTIKSHETGATASSSTAGSTPAATTPAATTPAAATPSPTANLTADQKKELDDWKAHLIPWTKVQGKDVSKTFNDKL
jgi:hypothetical protein